MQHERPNVPARLHRRGDGWRTVQARPARGTCRPPATALSRVYFYVYIYVYFYCAGRSRGFAVYNKCSFMNGPSNIALVVLNSDYTLIM